MSFLNTVGWLFFYLWQWRASSLALKLHREHSFDICHNLTYATWRVPSFLWRLGIPMVWGPVGGGQVTPAGFGSVLGFLGRIEDSWRNFCQFMARHDPLVRITMYNSAAILCVNRDTSGLIPERYHAKIFMALPLGVVVNPAPKREPRLRTLEILWVGRIVPWKGLPLLLRAMSRVRDIPVHLTVLGAGKDRSRCQKIAQRLKLNVTFDKWVPREKALLYYRKAHLFVFTSLHESFATTVMEAMASALPTILLDWGGNREIPDQCVVKIPANGANEVETKLAATIARFANSQDELAALGESGRAYAAKHYTWDARVRHILSIYRKLVPFSVIKAPRF